MRADIGDRIAQHHIPERWVDGDVLAQAKKERPENWTRYKVRTIIGEDGKPQRHTSGPKRGQVVTEAIPIEYVCAVVSETRDSHQRSRIPDMAPGDPGAGFFSSDAHSAHRAREDSYLRFGMQCMDIVMQLNWVAHAALELEASGLNSEAIGDKLGTNKHGALRYVDEGLAILKTFIALFPDYTWPSNIPRVLDIRRV